MSAPTHSAHHSSGPSSWHRRKMCPGSAALEASLPESPESSYAWEGTCAHAVLERCLKEFEGDASVFLGLPMEANGKTFVVTKGHVDGVNVALQWFKERLDEVGRADDDCIFYSERRVDLGQIEAGLFGTCDIFFLNKRARHLHVADYKHGAGVVVDATDNWQARGYAVGALKLFEGEAIDKVTVTIIQPRAAHVDGPVRSQTYDAFDIFDFIGEARAMLAETRKADAQRIPGDHCRFCRGASAMVCSEFKDGAVEAAKNAHDLIACPNKFDAEEFGMRLRQVSHIKMYLKKLEEFCNAEALKGNFPKGFNWYWGRGTRKWGDPQAAEKALLSALPEAVSAFDPPAIRSPAQIETAIGKKAFAETFAHLVETSRSPKLQMEAGSKSEPIPLTELRSSPNAFDIIATPQEE